LRSGFFAAVALACSTRLDMIATLAVCSAVFLLGLMSDYLFGLPSAPWQLVGFNALQCRPKLATFLARRRPGDRQEHVSMGLCRQGICLHDILRRRGPGRGSWHCLTNES